MGLFLKKKGEKKKRKTWWEKYKERMEKREKNRKIIKHVKKITKKVKKGKKKEKVKVKKIALKQIKKEASKLIPTILVEEIMERNPLTIDENISIERALEIMSIKGVDHVIVTARGKPVGILSDNNLTSFFSTTVPLENKDLSKYSEKIKDLSKNPVKTVMEKKVVCVKPNTPIEKAMLKLERSELPILCVVENKRLVGVVTLDNILKTLREIAIRNNALVSPVLKTGVDELYELVEEKGRISSNEAAKILGVDIKTIEEWAEILEEGELIKIEYPIVGKMELIKKEEKV